MKIGMMPDSMYFYLCIYIFEPTSVYLYAHIYRSVCGHFVCANVYLDLCVLAIRGVRQYVGNAQYPKYVGNT